MSQAVPCCVQRVLLTPSSTFYVNVNGANIYPNTAPQYDAPTYQNPYGTPNGQVPSSNNKVVLTPASTGSNQQQQPSNTLNQGVQRDSSNFGINNGQAWNGNETTYANTNTLNQIYRDPEINETPRTGQQTTNGSGNVIPLPLGATNDAPVTTTRTNLAPNQNQQNQNQQSQYYQAANAGFATNNNNANTATTQVPSGSTRQNGNNIVVPVINSNNNLNGQQTTINGQINGNTQRTTQSGSNQNTYTTVIPNQQTTNNRQGSSPPYNQAANPNFDSTTQRNIFVGNNQNNNQPQNGNNPNNNQANGNNNQANGSNNQNTQNPQTNTQVTPSNNNQGNLANNNLNNPNNQNGRNNTGALIAAGTGGVVATGAAVGGIIATNGNTLNGTARDDPTTMSADDAPLTQDPRFIYSKEGLITVGFANETFKSTANNTGASTQLPPTTTFAESTTNSRDGLSSTVNPNSSNQVTNNGRESTITPLNNQNGNNESPSTLLRDPQIDSTQNQNDVTQNGLNQNSGNGPNQNDATDPNNQNQNEFTPEALSTDDTTPTSTSSQLNSKFNSFLN
uniref:USP domain-containing protein n=1 Tax=Rhabditophanes sp. KR3021 TaxID=114890 RepID=A0AC35U9B9_9BILA